MISEAAIRLGSFISILTVMGIAESVWPRRILDISKKDRWLSNISISVISTFLVRLLIPIIPTSLAHYCAENGFGLFNLFSTPDWLTIPVSILFLDMVIYWQHVAFHKNRMLWRVHRMHHADTNIDASTGIRFHPIEIFLSMLIKLTAIFLLGPPAFAVLFFEIMLNGCALFNHSNIKLSTLIDSIFRIIIVTPDMHRVHHSTDMREANNNYGFSVTWWDKLFGTYKAQPDLGHNSMKIGLNLYRDASFIRLPKMLIIPFL